MRRETDSVLPGAGAGDDLEVGATVVDDLLLGRREGNGVRHRVNAGLMIGDFA